MKTREEIVEIFKSEMKLLNIEFVDDSSWNASRSVAFRKKNAKIFLVFDGDTASIEFSPNGSEKLFGLWLLCKAYPELNASNIKMTMENQLQIFKSNLSFLLDHEESYKAAYDKFNEVNDLSSFFANVEKK